MEIVLNGSPHQLGDQVSVAELIDSLNLSEKAVAVAVNRQIISRPKWNAHQLQAQDQVDVVRAIGGG